MELWRPVIVFMMAARHCLGSNLYDKLVPIKEEDRYLFKSAFNMFDGKAYEESSAKTLSVLASYPGLVPSYNYNLLSGVIMMVNPCEFDLEYCKTLGITALTDSPVLTTSRQF